MSAGTLVAAREERAARERLLEALVVGLPGVLALALCLVELGTRSLWLDESATVAIAGQHGAALGSALARDGGNMLGYYALIHLLIGAFGDGVLVLRLPSALAAGATATLTAAIARRLWDRTAAAAAGVLTAVSLTLVYWGQDARSYALMLALISGSFLALIALLDSERAGRGAAWLAYVVLTTGAVYSALAAALIVPAQLPVLAWRRERARALASAVALTAACCVPLAVLAAARGASQLFWVPSPSLRIAQQVLQALTSSGLQPGYYTAAGDALLILTCATLLAAAFAAIAGLWRRRVGAGWAAGGRVRERPAAIAVSWLVVPVLAALVVSAAGHSIFQARYVIVSLPAVALLLAGILRDRRLPRAAAGALLVALLALRVLALAPSYGVSSEQWQAATAYVAGHTRPGDCIAFYPLDARMPFAYYAASQPRLPTPVLPALRWGRVRSFVEEYRTLSPRQLAALPARCSRVWLVSSHRGRLGGPPVSGVNFDRLRALRDALAVRYPTQTARKLGSASPIWIELFTAGA